MDVRHCVVCSYLTEACAAPQAHAGSVTYGVTDHYTDNKLLIPDWLVNALRSVRLRGDRFNITARQLKTALNL